MSPQRYCISFYLWTRQLTSQTSAITANNEIDWKVVELRRVNGDGEDVDLEMT